MRWVFAALLVVHGIAHLVGFAVSWQLMNSPEVPYKTTLAGGVLDVGGIGMKAVGLLWLALAVAFVVSAVAIVFAWPAALSIALMTILASVIMCTVSLPEARIGLVIDVLLLLFLAFGPQAGLDLYEEGGPTRPREGALR